MYAHLGGKLDLQCGDSWGDGNFTVRWLRKHFWDMNKSANPFMEEVRGRVLLADNGSSLHMTSLSQHDMGEKAVLPCFNPDPMGQRHGGGESLVIKGSRHRMLWMDYCQEMTP